MDIWQGHLPITSEMLLRILEKAAAGENEFSRAERILYTTCEFWAAIAARSIVMHLGSEAVDNLRKAALAFSMIGAVQVENALNAVISGLANASTKRRYLECFAALEEDLPKTKDPVDQLIARFAEDLKKDSAIGAAGHSSVRVANEPNQAREGAVVRKKRRASGSANRLHDSMRINACK